MEIFNAYNEDWILQKLSFLFIFFAFYKGVLEYFSSMIMDKFEKENCEKIKNKYFYFFGLLFYGWFNAIIMTIILTSGVVLMFLTEPLIFNSFVLSIIVGFLYCFKKAFLMMDKHRNTHWY